MEEGEKKYFSVDEAEAQIPKLEGIMDRLMDLHSEAGRIRGLLQEEQRRIMLDGGRLVNVAEVRELKGRLGGLATELKLGIDEILGMGAVPKDLGRSEERRVGKECRL